MTTRSQENLLEKKTRFQRRGSSRGRGGASFTPQEFEQKMLEVRRVARVTKGGRRFGFRATIVIGNRKGRVGVGVAKGKDVAFAVEKAVRNARRDLIVVPMTPDGSIPHEIIGKQASARVLIMPSRGGRGIIAGGPVRVICDLAGFRDISAKIIGRTNNKLNNALATISALKQVHVVPAKEKKDNLDAPLKKEESQAGN